MIYLPTPFTHHFQHQECLLTMRTETSSPFSFNKLHRPNRTTLSSWQTLPPIFDSNGATHSLYLLPCPSSSSPHCSPSLNSPTSFQMLTIFFPFPSPPFYLFVTFENFPSSLCLWKLCEGVHGSNIMIDYGMEDSTT